MTAINSLHGRRAAPLKARSTALQDNADAQSADIRRCFLPRRRIR